MSEDKTNLMNRRLQNTRVHNQVMRQAQSAPSSISEEQLKLTKDLNTFQRDIRSYPLNVCFTCDRLFYPNGGSCVSLSSANNLLANLYRFDTTCPLPSLPLEDSGEGIWLCSRCMVYLKKRKIPPFSSVNNMRVCEVPPELACLNSMEQRLICKVQAFMKLLVLPLGQRALAGQTINFPVNVSEICNALPKPVNSDGIILVQAPQSSASVPNNNPPPTRPLNIYKERCNAPVCNPDNPVCNQDPPVCNNQENPVCNTVHNPVNQCNSFNRQTSLNNQIYTVRKHLIQNALSWLRENNPIYRDITIDMNVIEDSSPNDTTDSDSEEHQPVLESSVIRMDFTLPNVETYNIGHCIDYLALKASLLVYFMITKLKKWPFHVCFQMVSMVSVQHAIRLSVI